MLLEIVIDWKDGYKPKVLIDENASGEVLKALILKERNIDGDYDDVEISFKGMLLEDNQTLKQAGIKNDSVVVVTSYKKVAGILFVDGTGPKRPTQLIFDTKASKWRSISSGLSIEGKCYTENCEAYNQWVIFGRRMGTYDAIYDEHTNMCPMCKKYVTAEKFGFSNCLYSYKGVMIGSGGKHPKAVISEEIEVGGHYKLFDEEAANMNWLSLTISTTARKDP